MFDDEGTKTCKKEIVNKGEIKTFLYDIKEAKLKNVQPTGNRFEGISTRNMYVLPGKKTDQELFAEYIDNDSSSYWIYIVIYFVSIFIFNALIK